MSAIFTSFSHIHHGANAINLGLVKHSKMEQCLGGGLLSLSLSLVSLLFAIYFFNFLNLFARLVILSVAKNPHKLKENLPFVDTSLTLIPSEAKYPQI